VVLIDPLVFITIEEFDKAMILSNIYFPVVVPYLRTFLVQRKVIAGAMGEHISMGNLIPEKQFLALADTCLKVDDQYATFLEVAYQLARDMNLSYYRHLRSRFFKRNPLKNIKYPT
jgi:hypothetical protein